MPVLRDLLIEGFELWEDAKPTGASGRCPAGFHKHPDSGACVDVGSLEHGVAHAKAKLKAKAALAAIEKAKESGDPGKVKAARAAYEKHFKASDKAAAEHHHGKAKEHAAKANFHEREYQKAKEAEKAGDKEAGARAEHHRSEAIKAKAKAGYHALRHFQHGEMWKGKEGAPEPPAKGGKGKEGERTAAERPAARRTAQTAAERPAAQKSLPRTREQPAASRTRSGHAATVQGVTPRGTGGFGIRRWGA